MFTHLLPYPLQQATFTHGKFKDFQLSVYPNSKKGIQIYKLLKLRGLKLTILTRTRTNNGAYIISDKICV